VLSSSHESNEGFSNKLEKANVKTKRNPKIMALSLIGKFI